MTWSKDRSNKFYNNEPEPEEDEPEDHGNLRGTVIPSRFERIPYTENEVQTTLTPHELQNLIKASYNDNDNAEIIGNDIDYTLDKELSTPNHKVFIDNKDNDVVVSFAGTYKNEDYISDAALALGLLDHTRRFKDSRSLIENIKFKYKQSPILAIGDSLGGSIAESVGDKVDRVITHNKGSSFFDVGKSIRPNQIDIRHTNDWVSALSKTQHGGKDRITIDNGKTGFFESHDHNNIKDLKGQRDIL
jgi:hypothetical protein